MDVFESLRPLFFISRVFGVAPFTVKNRTLVKSRRHLVYSFVILGLGNVILVRELVKKGFFEVGRIREPLWSVTVLLKLTIFSTCSLLTMVNSVFRVSFVAKTFNRINELCRLMGIINYETLSVFTLRLLFINLFMYFLTFCHSFIGFYNASVLQMLQVLFQYIFFFFINTTTIHFIIFVFLVRLVYETMCQVLTNLSKEVTSVARVVEEIRSMQESDLIVKSIADDINAIYMPILLLYIFWLFTNKIHGFMWITHEEFSWVPLVLYSVCFDGIVVYVLKICTSSYGEAEKTANYLHELFIDNDDPELKEEIEIFSLQLLHRKVEFNACGFFKLDFSLLYSMVGAVTTYIIILMQFQGNDAGGYRNCTSINCSNCTTVS